MLGLASDFPATSLTPGLNLGVRNAVFRRKSQILHGICWVAFILDGLSYLLYQNFSLIVIQVFPLATAKYYRIPRPGRRLFVGWIFTMFRRCLGSPSRVCIVQRRPWDHVEVDMRYNLSRARAIVLDNVVVDFIMRDIGQHRFQYRSGQQGQYSTDFSALTCTQVTDLDPMLPGSDQDVAPRQRHDVEKCYDVFI